MPSSANYDFGRSFAAPRHLGVDIFAPRGTPVLAVTSGHARATIEPKGGNVAYLDADDGWSYFFGHLDKWALPVLRPGGARVMAGEPVGRVGNTGNASGKPPHVHFQARKGSLMVDPFDELDRVDPHHRGRPAPESGPALVALFALWWLWSS